MPTDEPRIRATLLELVAQRGPGKTICPSEVARALGDNWRDLMPAVRAVAAQLVAEGRIVVTQRGKIVDLHRVKGPVRYGQAQGPGALP